MGRGWKVTERSLVDRPPHCGRGLSTPAVPHPHSGDSNYCDELIVLRRIEACTRWRAGCRGS